MPPQLSLPSRKRHLGFYKSCLARNFNTFIADSDNSCVCLYKKN
ncbi:hypothetical protein [Bacillus phage FI_KG-Lek]|nr:hypothetical protein [Bacillus phage FI_KG-Lek]